MSSLRVAARHFLMQDAAACGHPLDVAGAEAAVVAEAVAMFDVAGQECRKRQAGKLQRRERQGLGRAGGETMNRSIRIGERKGIAVRHRKCQPYRIERIAVAGEIGRCKPEVKRYRRALGARCDYRSHRRRRRVDRLGGRRSAV